ncbi:MAG: single-stranded DNA-binding protein [Chlamydiales bacterium]
MIIVEIAGFLGADPEERFTSNGKRIVMLRVATRVRQGGRDETVWWRVNIWGNRFDNMIPYLKKGSGVIVLGDMSKPETYVGKDGTHQISLTLSAELIKFSPFGRSETQRHSENQEIATSSVSSEVEENQQGTYVTTGADQESAFVGDDLPF